MSIWTESAILDGMDWLELAVRLLPDGRFVLLSPVEIRHKKRALIDDVKRDTAFKLLAKFEADLNAEFRASIWSPSKERPYAIELKQTFMKRWRTDQHRRRKKSHVERLFGPEDILAVLRDHLKSPNPTASSACSHLRGLFRHFRNWYAHGRYGNSDSDWPDPRELAREIRHVKAALSIP